MAWHSLHMDTPTPSLHADLNALRLEGMVILDRCLRERQAAAFERFLAVQLGAEPPPLQFLQEMAQDVQHRLQAMRQTHFDHRDGLLRRLTETAASSTPAAPMPASFSRHALEQFGHALREHDSPAAAELRALLEEALRSETDNIAQQRMLQQVHATILDWLRAFSVVAARQAQQDMSEQIVQNVWSLRL